MVVKTLMKTISSLLFTLYLISYSSAFAIEIPTHQVIEPENLSKYLKEDIKKQISADDATIKEDLAAYLRDKFSERYFYDWKKFDERFSIYNQIYDTQSSHASNALDHMQKFADSTQWKLPFDYLNGEEVNAYALRHLARQHKMVDIAFQYYYSDKNPKYIHYFVNQMRSLNAALALGEYEKVKDGNGVYEVFRSGYRVLNWLVVHTMFLGEDIYTDEVQLETIATLLQHGSHLYANNENFHSGNHQTKGMSALAMLAILLRDFEGTDQWYQRAMKRLEEHLSKEINKDGFQFERSVHYHMNDISNFFYVYQLAKISNIEVGELWEEKLRSLFTTLAKIAYPDKTAPVLQDDTEIPWGEKNVISGKMTLGYLLFEDPELGYFAEDRVEDRMYWFLQKKQLDLLASVAQQKPAYSSLIFPETHYYIMREGWNKNAKMMIISAGLDSEKPDHQHGDMLGVQAMANAQVILPNYQVRYSLKDFEFFKNSMVKNVALVDNELQGKKWTSNKGGSGFGKFKQLPNPATIVWKSNDTFDLFAGSHDGFMNVGVTYSRQVIYVKDDFWIVKDNFSSDSTHEYKQVWQGHFTTEEGPNLIKSTFENASGCDIFQLNGIDRVTSSGSRGKQWTVVSKTNEYEFSFVTAVFPYMGYNSRIDETAENPMLKGWKVNALPYPAEGRQMRSLSKGQESYLFNVRQIAIEGIQVVFSVEADVYVKIRNNDISFHSIGYKESEIVIEGSKFNRLGDIQVEGKVVLKPGELLECVKN